MKYSSKQVSRTAGTLIILGMLTGIFSVVPSLETEKFLTEVFPNKIQVFTGATFQFLLIPIYIGFSLLLYPILRQYNKTLSLGFVGFRFMAASFQLIGIMLLPIFVLLSQNYGGADPADTPVYESAGNILRLFRDLTNHLGVILATGLGNLLFYAVLYKEKLVPRWLSVWGVSGNLLIMTAGFLILFQTVEVVSPEYGILAVPLVLQEIVLAIWLLVKGLPAKIKTGAD